MLHVVASLSLSKLFFFFLCPTFPHRPFSPPPSTPLSWKRLAIQSGVVCEAQTGFATEWSNFELIMSGRVYLLTISGRAFLCFGDSPLLTRRPHPASRQSSAYLLLPLPLQFSVSCL